MEDKKKNELDDLFGTMRNHNFKDLKTTLDWYDVEENFKPWGEIKERDLFKDIQGKSDYPIIGKRTVLGFDMLGYSQMEKEKQNLVPFLLSLLINKTYESLLEYEKFYNYFCQLSFDHYIEDTKEPHKNYNRIRVSLGNLNPQGLE